MQPWQSLGCLELESKIYASKAIVIMKGTVHSSCPVFPILNSPELGFRWPEKNTKEKRQLAYSVVVAHLSMFQNWRVEHGC